MNYNGWQRIRRAKLKSEGICVDCKRQPAGEGHVVCPNCRSDRRLREEKRVLRLAGEGWKQWRAA